MFSDDQLMHNTTARTCTEPDSDAGITEEWYHSHSLVVDSVTYITSFKL